MPPKKIPYSKLSKSAKWYRDNPQGRKDKAKDDTKINERPSQIKKRTEANAKRAKAKKAGKNIKGKDASHTKNGMVFKPMATNRGSKSDSAGDRNARGGKK